MKTFIALMILMTLTSCVTLAEKESSSERQDRLFKARMDARSRN